MGLYRNSSDPHCGLLRGGNAVKGGSIKTTLYVSGARVTIILVAMTTAAAIYGGINTGLPADGDNFGLCPLRTCATPTGKSAYRVRAGVAKSFADVH